MARYSVGAYTYEDDSPDTMIYDGLTGIPLSLGYELVSQERGDTVRVVALGVKDDTAGPCRLRRSGRARTPWHPSTTCAP